MGNTKGITTYLTAMIAQYDATLCALKGCDQGFHNYLYYSGKLLGAVTDIQVFDQGEGNVNNLGALRDVPLKERGILDDQGMVLNNDKSISKVAHQVDRDSGLNIIIKARKKVFKNKWDETKKTMKK
eukprot:CAMPEP_0172497192 /NCGR_PEP_ID=MMETSP1066-20121228/96433_1 /TAXON_ID=671091 /ORGANISM="Coscinodiscus wailesii, Strain CCMP2513" /LENGTH=126 /DNA_ID=CAMNT_0013269823 /DNA_START=364 /DNA_END=747 /DNA_ORIENTATION=-